MFNRPITHEIPDSPLEFDQQQSKEDGKMSM